MKYRQNKFIDLSQFKANLPCPLCGHKYLRTHSTGTRNIACLRSDLYVRYHKYQCVDCCRYPITDMSKYAKAGYQYTHRVMRLALAMHKTGRYSLVRINDVFLRQYRLVLPKQTVHEWVTTANET